MIDIRPLVKLLLFSFIFLLQSHLTIQFAPLAKHWNVPEKQVPKLLAIERVLVNATRNITPLLHQYNTSFGGTYIDVKENKVFINTIDTTKIKIIRSSSKIKKFVKLLKFKPAKYSLAQLESSVNKLDKLATSTNPNNVLISIDPKRNRIIIDLNHADDNENEAFINGVKKFESKTIKPSESIIIINYVSKSNNIADPPTSKPQIKRQSKRYILHELQGGDGLAIFQNNTLQIPCSVAFWVRHRPTRTEGVFTSSLCLPETLFFGEDIYHHSWDLPPHEEGDLTYFGQLLDINKFIDYAIIHKTNGDYNPNGQITNLDDRFYPTIFINEFERSGETNVAGQYICKSGFRSHVTCGSVISSAANFYKRRIINGTSIRTRYTSMIKAYLLTVESDSGGTVFRFSNVPNDQIDINLRMITVIGLVSIQFGNESSQLGYSWVTLFQQTKHILQRLRHYDVITFNNTR